MIVKWTTGRYLAARIERVECSRETEKAVWVMEYPWVDGGRDHTPVERRRMKQSEGEKFHDTWEAAHLFLCEQAASGLQDARNRLGQAQSVFGNVRGMRKPVKEA